MYCKNCGRQIDPDANYCIHCGAAQNSPPPRDQQPPAASPRRTNGFGIAGFVLAIVTISTWYLCLFGVAPLISLVLSSVGMYRRRYCNYANKLTLAGFSIISVAIAFLYTAEYLNLISGT